MDERGLGVLELARDVAREAEVRILINRAGNERGDVGRGAEDLGEGIGEGRRSLDGDEVDFANVVAVGDASEKER